MKFTKYFTALQLLFVFASHAQWARIDSITQGSINSINFINADTGFVYNQPGIIWRTANGGQSWDSIPLNFTGYIKDMAFANNSVGYAVGGAWFPHGVHYPFAIYKTMDGGLSWDSIFAGSSGGVFTHVAVTGVNEFFASSQEGMLHSADGGQTLDTVSVTNMPWGTEQYTRVRFLNATEGYVLSRSNFFTGHLFNLYKTANGGQSWQSIHADTNLNFSLDFIMTPQGNGIIVGNESFLLRTTNGGTNWDTVPLPNNKIVFRQIEEINGHLFAMGSDISDTSSCIFSSTDWGSIWQKQFCRKANTGGLVDMSFAGPNVGYCTDWRNVYKNDQLVSLREEASAFTFDVYPNPVSDQLTIALPQPGPAEITIYNSIGEKVLVRSKKAHSTLALDVSALTNGFYLLEVQQSDKREVRRVVKE